MKKYVVEFIGTFFLLFVIGLCVIEPGAGGMAPLAIGMIFPRKSGHNEEMVLV